MTDKTLEAQPDEAPSDVREEDAPETVTHTWTVLKRDELRPEAARQVWTEVGTMETEYHGWLEWRESEQIGPRFGAGEFLLVAPSWKACERFRIVAETTYRQAEDES